MNLKVALLTDIPILCDMGMYLEELKRILSKRGIYTEVFLITGSQNLLESRAGLTRMMSLFRLLEKLSKFDLIHIQFTAPLGCALAFFESLRLIKRPFILHTHGYDVFTVPSIGYGMRRLRLGRLIASYSWRRANRLLAVSKNAKHEIEKANIDPEKISILYNGVNEDLFKKYPSAEMPEDLKLIRERSDFIFLSVASLKPVKNHGRLIEAFQRIFENKSVDRVKLILIGEGSAIDPPSCARTENIIYLGKKAHCELPMYYNLADAFVLPSLSEGHPWSVLEAMACELPVIASAVGGIPETLNDKDFLVNPLDTGNITEKLQLVMNLDRKQRSRIGVKNRIKILNSYTIESHVTQLIGVYQSLIH